MRILKVISRLLDYPRVELKCYRADLALEISDSREISPEMRLRLIDALAFLCDGELMDAQENYGLLFDQGRSVSLHLFEHVHGESRDRGQAMVDLIDIYRRNGFQLNAHELPDYLPMFLEYLSSRPDLEVREWLADVSHIIARVAARLEQRGHREPGAIVAGLALGELVGADDDFGYFKRAELALPDRGVIRLGFENPAGQEEFFGGGLAIHGQWQWLGQ